jgi:hypothetical protein
MIRVEKKEEKRVDERQETERKKKPCLHDLMEEE